MYYKKLGTFMYIIILSFAIAVMHMFFFCPLLVSLVMNY